MFKGRERIAAEVHRWSTMPRIKEQSMAEHSFYVALYAMHLCDFLKLPLPRRYPIVQWALIHDMPETVTSDIPGPVKRQVTNHRQMEVLEKKIFEELGSSYWPYPEAQTRDIVKAANLIDEIFYIHSERVMGNGYLAKVWDNSWARMEAALNKIDAGELVFVISQELEAMVEGVVPLKDPEGG